MNRPTTSPARRHYRRRTVQSGIVAAILLALGACSGSTAPADDRFVDFEPEVEMFPSAPVADADVTFGLNQPQHWQWDPTYCSVPRLADSTTDSPAGYEVTAHDWKGVRYDWSEAGVAKSWIISEQTIGFADDGKRDRYLDEFRSAIDRCGWEYGGTGGFGFNASPFAVPSLPSGSVAYTAEQDPNVSAISAGNSYLARTVLIPGEQSNHLIVVTWIGWGTTVPTDQFEPVAAELAAAANATTGPQQGSDG